MDSKKLHQYIEENKGWFYSRMHFEEDHKLNTAMKIKKEKESNEREKHQSSITFDENDINNRFEIWEGQKRFLTPHSTVENIVSANLLSILENYNMIHGCGILFSSNVSIYFKNDENANDYLTPKITFVKPENSSIVKVKGIYGVPDLIVEVTSGRNNENFNMKEKFEIYEGFGVKELWIVNPYCPNDSQIGIYTITSNKYIRVQVSVIFKELIFPLNL